MLTAEEKQKAIEYLVHDVYMIEHNKCLATFLTKYSEQVRKSMALSLQIGIPIAYPPVQLDLREPLQQLVNNLVQFEILHKQNGNTKKEK